MSPRTALPMVPLLDAGDLPDDRGRLTFAMEGT